MNENRIDESDLPRPGSVMHNFHNQDEVFKKKVLKKWLKLNKYLMIPLYRVKLLPLFGIGKIFLLLKTKGWKTGKERRTPLEYRKYENIITIFAARGEDATWVKNIRANPNDVSVTVGFHHFKPQIEFVSDIEQKFQIMKWYISKYGKAAKMLFGWEPKKDTLDAINLSNLVNLLSIIHLKKT